jgi:hypothetical protein
MLTAVNLALSDGATKSVTSASLLILDANGTPIAAFEQLGAKVTSVYTHTNPSDMQQFLDRHGLSHKKVDLNVIRTG